MWCCYLWFDSLTHLSLHPCYWKWFVNCCFFLIYLSNLLIFLSLQLFYWLIIASGLVCSLASLYTFLAIISLWSFISFWSIIKNIVLATLECENYSFFIECFLMLFKAWANLLFFDHWSQFTFCSCSPLWYADYSCYHYFSNWIKK